MFIAAFLILYGSTTTGTRASRIIIVEYQILILRVGSEIVLSSKPCRKPLLGERGALIPRPRLVVTVPSGSR